MALTSTLLAVSAGAFALGLYYPLGALAGHSVMSYGVIFVSWPAWIVGAICGSLAARRASRQQPVDRTMLRVAVALALLHVTAALASLVIPFRYVN